MSRHRNFNELHEQLAQKVGEEKLAENARRVAADYDAARPTIANMPGADLPVTFASGETRNVNMIVLLAETLDAEHYAKYGHHRAPNAPDIKQLREKYELDYFFDGPVKTWDDCAAVMRHFYGVCDKHIRKAQS